MGYRYAKREIKWLKMGYKAKFSGHYGTDLKNNEG